MNNPDDEELRTCSNCGREIFSLPDEGIAGDEKLCTDCWEDDGEFC